MNIKETNISGLLVIQPEIYSDSRGHFMDIYEESIYEDFIGEKVRFIKDSVSYSKKSVLRGMHFQKDFPQGKLVYVPFGRIFDVVVDLRRESKTFGKHFSVILDDDKHNQLWIPPGFAHGFNVLSKEAKVFYKLTEIYRPDDEYTLYWNDPVIDIEWPEKNPIVSKKDKLGMSFNDIQNM
tara:strand:+ start:410 stop:949 length:540 start_codon:yes stop_codon:yes gene_type:complete